MRSAVPVAELLDDPDLDSGLRAQLEMAGAAVKFAHATLKLPDNGSYSKFADLERSAVVWNVFAAPEFSLEPLKWCFPVAGCVSYRGYFNREKAEAYAQSLRDDGHDVFVGSVAAYSTLGRFRDPLVSPMFGGSDSALVSTIFHELAHQRFYLPGDTQFNESFATAVAGAGLQRWFESRGNAGAHDEWLESQQASRTARRLLGEAHETLSAVYAGPAPASAMRAQKKSILDMLGSQLNGGFAELNNAVLAAYAAYDTRVGAFTRLLASCDGDFERFYIAAEAIARLHAEERTAELDRLDSETSPSAPGAVSPCRPAELQVQAISHPRRPGRVRSAT
jgi:predicted aminopeptidase